MVERFPLPRQFVDSLFRAPDALPQRVEFPTFLGGAPPCAASIIECCSNPAVRGPGAVEQ